MSWITDSGAVVAGSGNPNIELDTYLGFRNTLDNEFSYDVGFVRYNYLGSYAAATGFAKADTDEVYAAVGYKWGGVKYSHGLGQFLTVPGAAGTNYLEINANVPLGDSGVTLIAHAGKQTFKPASASIYIYTDYKFGVSKDFSGFLATLAYTNTNAGPAWNYVTGGNWGKGVAALTASRSF